MINRASILSLIAILSLFLVGECSSVNKIEAKSTQSAPRQTEISIVDADIPNPTSLLSGKGSSRTVNSSRRSVQRPLCKRTFNVGFTPRFESGSTVAEHFSNTNRPNILGGVVADRAFYSLCCLRI